MVETTGFWGVHNIDQKYSNNNNTSLCRYNLKLLFTILMLHHFDTVIHVHVFNKGVMWTLEYMYLFVEGLTYTDNVIAMKQLQWKV